MEVVVKPGLNSAKVHCLQKWIPAGHVHLLGI
jgi:hypothetical protein